MKLTDTIKTANTNLWRNKARSILTIIAIFVGSFAIITTTAIQTGVNDFIDSQVDAVGGEGFLQIMPLDEESLLSSNITVGGPQKYNPDKITNLNQANIAPETIQQVKEIAGIIPDSVLVSHFGVATYAQSTKNQERYLITLSIFTDSVILDLSAGRSVNNQSSEYEIVLAPDWANALGYADDEAALGQQLILASVDQYTGEITEFTATIVGVQAPSVITGNSPVINTTLNDTLYQEYTKYWPPAEKEAVQMLAASYDYQNYSADDIKSALKELGLTAYTIKDIVGQIKTFFDVIITVFRIFGYIALIAAAIGIINTLLMSVQERTREIGLNKALGLSPAKIFLSFSIEAVLLGFWGSVFGTIISMIIGYLVDAVAHGQDAFLATFPTFHLVKYTPTTIIPVIILIMVIAFIAGTMPARQAAKKDPIEALRYE